ncbi:MAG: hypothetical protein V4714_13135 [Bacteroidota bacterium]
MNRVRISKNLEIGKYLMLAIGIAMVVAILTTVNDSEGSVAFFIFLFVSVILFFLFHYSKTVEFDEDFMYVSGRQINTKVPLVRVYKIKRTMTQINKQYMWKISYYDEQDAEQSVRILPKVGNGRFDHFTDLVKEKNQAAQIKNWSHSFDFDQ